MRNIESLIGYSLVSIEQNVEVNVSRALVNELTATEMSLYRLKLIQEGHWCKFCLDLYIHGK